MQIMFLYLYKVGIFMQFPKVSRITRILRLSKIDDVSRALTSVPDTLSISAPRLMKATSMAERTLFGQKFCESMGIPETSVIQKIAAIMSKVEIIKNKEGKIIGGFSYNIISKPFGILFSTPKRMHIGQMFLDKDFRKTPEGRRLLLEMAKRIKRIAQQSNSSKITCDVCVTQPAIERLYKNHCFSRSKEKTILSNLLHRMEAKTEEFCPDI